MKKLIALSTLVAAGASFAASNTSTKKLSVSEMSLKERISFSYFGEALKSKIGSESKDSELYNSVSLKYKMTDKVTGVFNPRFTIQDSSKDKMNEHDLRLGLHGSYLHDDVITLLQAIVPTTEATTEAAELITQIRFYNGMDFKMDDYNNVHAAVQLRRDVKKASITEQKEYDVLPYVSYTNSAFSEKYKLRVDWEGYLSHVQGKALNHMKVRTSERIVAGVHMSKIIGSASLYPYIQHNPSKGKNTEQLGMGAQFSASF